MNEHQKINIACQYIQNAIPERPQTAVVLGSGLGGLVDKLLITKKIPYGDIPFFPVSTVAGHSGELVFGTLSGTEVCVLNGRKHYYEGVAIREVVFPILVLHAIGIRNVILSNAAGGLNPSFQVGDLMVMTDHINHFWNTPLFADPNAFLSKKSATPVYSTEMISLALRTAENLQIPLQHGVYLAHSGPYYGTAAESRMQHRLGADAVGMSTIPEAIMAKSLNMNVLAFSVITDLAYNGVDIHPSHEVVLKAAQSAGSKLVQIVTDLLPQIR